MGLSVDIHPHDLVQIERGLLRFFVLLVFCLGFILLGFVLVVNCRLARRLVLLVFKRLVVATALLLTAYFAIGEQLRFRHLGGRGALALWWRRVLAIQLTLVVLNHVLEVIFAGHSLPPFIAECRFPR